LMEDDEIDADDALRDHDEYESGGGSDGDADDW